MGPRAGTKEFIESLRKRKFAKCQDVVISAKGSELAELVEKTSFRQPFHIASPEGLELQLPPPGFAIRDVVETVGPDRVVDVIDVHEQHDFKMNLGDFFKWFHQEDRGDKIYNVLSLEISDTPLSQLIVPPKIVRDLSLVNRCWPDAETSGIDLGDSPEEARPEVLKFCLMSSGQSYTDFHIDFGGSSVWYHILWGEKIFYLIPPSETNLDRYESWMESQGNLTEFLGDRCPGEVYQLRVTTGNTIVLPSGWVHAVYTPCDSLVFGGNFLHLHSVEMQIRIHEMEQRLATERRFQFPLFEKLHWYAAQLFMDQYQGDMDDHVLPEFGHVESMRYMVQALTRWYDKRKGSPYQSEYVPDNLHLPPRLLLREFDKVIQHFYRAHCRQRGTTAGGGGSGGDSAAGKGEAAIKLKIKRHPETKGSRKVVKHVIEQVGSETSNPTTAAATSGTEAQVAKPSASLSPIKRRQQQSDDEEAKMKKYKKKKQSRQGLKQKRQPKVYAADEDESDEGIDVAKCTEDEQFYYPAIDERDAAAEDDANWKPKKKHAEKLKLQQQQQQQQHEAPTSPNRHRQKPQQQQLQQQQQLKPKHSCSHATTAKQRLGKKLGLFKSSRMF